MAARKPDTKGRKMPANERIWPVKVKYADGTTVVRTIVAPTREASLNAAWPHGYDPHSTIVAAHVLIEDDGSMSEPVGRCQ
jgi:hypothetical protein